MIRIIIIIALMVTAVLCDPFARWLKDHQPNTQWVTGSTIELIEMFEGKKHTAYQDIKGKWTIGVGHLIKKEDRHLLHTRLSEEEVMGILHKDLELCTEALKTAVKVPINRPQTDAMHSLCHNIGPDNFMRSDVVKHLNDGNTKKAADSFLNWSKPAVLKKRREAERELFLTNI